MARGRVADRLRFPVALRSGRPGSRVVEEHNREGASCKHLRVPSSFTSSPPPSSQGGPFDRSWSRWGRMVIRSSSWRTSSARSSCDTVLIGAMAAAAIGPPDEAERLSLEALELARELRSPRVRATGLLAGARAALRSGSPSRAQSRLRAARLIIEQKKIRVMRCEALLFDAWVALDRGAWDKVSNLSVRLGAAVRASDWLIPLVPLLRGRASLGTGRPDEA